MSKLPVLRIINQTMTRIRPGLVSLVAVTLLSAGCNTESVKDSSSGNQLASNQSDRECRGQAVTGTLIKKQICKSASTWKAIDEAERRSADEYIRGTSDRSAGVSGTGAPNPDGSITMPSANNPMQ